MTTSLLFVVFLCFDIGTALPVQGSFEAFVDGIEFGGSPDLEAKLFGTEDLLQVDKGWEVVHPPISPKLKQLKEHKEKTKQVAKSNGDKQSEAKIDAPPAAETVVTPDTTTESSSAVKEATTTTTTAEKESKETAEVESSSVTETTADTDKATTDTDKTTTNPETTTTDTDKTTTNTDATTTNTETTTTAESKDTTTTNNAMEADTVSNQQESTTEANTATPISEESMTRVTSEEAGEMMNEQAASNDETQQAATSTRSTNANKEAETNTLSALDPDVSRQLVVAENESDFLTTNTSADSVENGGTLSLLPDTATTSTMAEAQPSKEMTGQQEEAKVVSDEQVATKAEENVISPQDESSLFSTVSGCSGRNGGDDEQFFTVWVTEEKTFGWRQRASVESVFFHHPQAHVTILSDSLSQEDFESLNQAGCRVDVKPIDLQTNAKGTGLESWANTVDFWKKSEFFPLHLTEAVRLLELHQNGGTYFDADIVFVNPITSMHNVVGLSELGGGAVRIQGTVMRFEKSNSFIDACIEGFANSYDPQAKFGVLPGVMTQVWESKFKGGRSAVELNVLGSAAFDLIREKSIPDFARSNKIDLVRHDVAYLEQHSFGLHIKNEAVQSLSIEKGSLFSALLNRYCVECAWRD